MPKAIDSLIRDAVNEFFRGTEDGDSIQRQLNLIAECELRHTAVGFVCDFSVDKSAPQVLGGATKRLGGLEGLLCPNAVKCGFELWIDAGRIACLEGFTYSDQWPDSITSCSFSRTLNHGFA